MRWVPARTDDGAPALVLERRGQRLAESMLIVLHEGGFWLVDAGGDILASATDLPALLDAVDGGVAEPAPPRRRPERPALLAGFGALVPRAA